MTTILFLAADPTDMSRLRTSEETREIQEKIQLSRERENFVVQYRLSVRPADISQALLDLAPQIVHFSGHGTDSGALCFEDKYGDMVPVKSSALAALFEQFSKHIDCVILNACYSLIQAEAISKHIRYVIGMSDAIGDRAAIAFSIGFYQALGSGRTIEESYKLGCVQLQLQNIPEHLTPILIKDNHVPRLSINPIPSATDITTTSSRFTTVKPPAVIRPYNLGFDGPIINDHPEGWFNSRYFVDNVSIEYEIQVVSRPDDGTGSCVFYRRNKASGADKFSSLMQRCPAHFLAGQTIRFKGELTTTAVEGWAGLWLRANSKNRFNLFFDNMSNRPIRGTTTWTTYKIDAQIPSKTAWLNYGVLLSGLGTLWADNFQLLVWNAGKWSEI